MRAKSLSLRLALFITSLLLATTATLLAAMWVSVGQHARNQVDTSLEVGVKIVEQVLASKQRQLRNVADVLTADFGFRDAVASRDNATIKSTLINQLERVDADVMAVLSLDGEIVESTLNSDSRDKNPDSLFSGDVIDKLMVDGLMLSMTSYDGVIYQLLWKRIDAPLPIAVSVLGFALDDGLADELKNITNLDISFTDHSLLTAQPLVTTVDSAAYQSLSDSIAGLSLSWRFPFVHFPRYKSRGIKLYDEGNSQIKVYLTGDLDRVYAEFNSLPLLLSAIVLLAVSIALLLVTLFSRGLTRPLLQLAEAARVIAKGDYSTNIKTGSSTQELNQLELAMSSMQKDIRDREEIISYQAAHDVLTGLLNRAEITRVITEKVASSQRFYLIGVNVANLRATNNMFGHPIGDKCLQAIAGRLDSVSNLSAHIGGGNFINLFDGEVEKSTVDQLYALLYEAYRISQVDIKLVINMGVVAYPAQANSAASLIRRMEIAVDFANSSAGNIHFYVDGQEDNYITRLQLVDDLREALNTKETSLDVYYQPKMNLRTGEVSRLEALVQWQHAERGFIPSDVFIPLAEQSGLINLVTQWVINRVARDLAAWGALTDNFQVAINLSAQDITQVELLDFIDKTCQQFAIRPDNLAFEITEGELMRDPETAVLLLKKFRDGGYDLAIDDFGTGYSSLLQLKNMPVSELKIDREFVMSLARDEDDQTIVQSTINLAHSFGLAIVAEGVEDTESMKLLRQWGCEWVQGYWLARPMPAEQLAQWLSEYKNPFEQG